MEEIEKMRIGFDRKAAFRGVSFFIVGKIRLCKITAWLRTDNFVVFRLFKNWINLLAENNKAKSLL